MGPSGVYLVGTSVVSRKTIFFYSGTVRTIPRRHQGIFDVLVHVRKIVYGVWKSYNRGVTEVKTEYEI